MSGRLATLAASGAAALAASRARRSLRRQAPTSRVSGATRNPTVVVEDPGEIDDCPGEQGCVALALTSSVARTPLDLLDDAGRRDPYQVLRIPFLSGKMRIRQAYADICRSEHPDKNGGQESLEWQMARWAYQTLMDPQERARYDSSRITRNALSLTEGIFAFGFAVAKSFGTFVTDVAEVASKEVSNFSSPEFVFFNPSRLLGVGVESISGRSSTAVADEARI